MLGPLCLASPECFVCTVANTNDDVTVLRAADADDDVSGSPQLGSSAARCMMLVAVCEHVHRLDADDACAWYIGDAAAATAATAAASGASSASLLHAVFASFSDCYLEVCRISRVKQCCTTIFAVFFGLHIFD